ncbi:hypothetical protein MMC17_000865 [Xylographa soralifera]|nr:hypothetical protein [Xylographa soralifera]
MSRFGSIVTGITTKASAEAQIIPAVPIPDMTNDSKTAESKGGYGPSSLQPAHLNHQYYGATSLASLARQIHSCLQELVRNNEDSLMSNSDTGLIENSLRQCVILMEDMAKSLDTERQFQGSDSQPLDLPPQRLLEAFVEPFFSKVNWLLPIFRRSTIAEYLHQTYDSGNEADHARMLCLNNILLLGLNSNPTSQGQNATGNALEAELIRPFQLNFRRGLNKLERLLEPGLANVQALLSMCVIAERNLHCRQASLLIHQACFVAKSMGLHQQGTASGDQSSEEALERNCVFWALYVMDKTISTSLGIPCCLPSFDCDVSLPENDPTNPYLKHWIARIEVATIQEDTYQSLYSTQACRRGESERKTQIARLDRKLALWSDKNNHLCETDTTEENNMSQKSLCPANVALSYFYHSTRILIHRAGKELTNKQRCRDATRVCVHLFVLLGHGSLSVDAKIWLRQIAQNYLLVPFCLLFVNIIEDPRSGAAAEDLQLMLLANETLQQNQRSESSWSQIPQRSILASSCCQAANMIMLRFNAPPTQQPAGMTNSTLQCSTNRDTPNADEDHWPLANIQPTSPSLTTPLDTCNGHQYWNLDFSNLTDPVTGIMMSNSPPVGLSTPMSNSAHGEAPKTQPQTADANMVALSSSQRTPATASGRLSGGLGSWMGTNDFQINQKWAETWLR